MRNLKDLPKADLHCHLEGSARPDTLAEFAAKYQAVFTNSQNFNDLPSFLRKFEEARSLIRSIDDLERIAKECIEDVALSGGVYCEIDWAPHFYTRLNGLDGSSEANRIEEIFQRVHTAMSAAAETAGMTFGHLMGVDKSNPRQAQDIAEFGIAHMRDKVVSFGFAGNEKIPHDSMQGAVETAMHGGLNFIPHAGEVCGAESVEQVLAYRPRRIAHGFRATEDSRVLTLLKEANVACDIALSSNVGLGIVHDYTTHPVTILLKHDIPITLNTDDSLFFGSSLLHEYELARLHLKLDDESLAKIASNSISYSGADANWKRTHIAAVEKWLLY